MKSRNSSPQTSPQVVRRYRVESSGEDKENKGGLKASPRKPSLRIEQLAPSTMNGSSEQHNGSLNVRRDSSNGRRDITPRPGLLGPIPNGVRKVSGEASTTPLRPMLNGYSTSPSIPNASSSPGLENGESPSWSAIGHANTTGKSGRIIDKLMGENDKMRRELKEAQLQVQQMQDELATVKPRMDQLRQEKENLLHTSSVDSNLLLRRERKIEELKTENAAKTERMEKAEALLRQQQQQIVELKEQHSRELQSMVELEKHAMVHADIMATSHKQLSAEYKARGEKWKRDVDDLYEALEHNRQVVAKRDVVQEHMRKEGERTRKVDAELVALREEFEKLKTIAVEEARKETESLRDKRREMDEVTKQMRWVIGVHGCRSDGEEVPAGKTRRDDSKVLSTEGSSSFEQVWV